MAKNLAFKSHPNGQHVLKVQDGDKTFWVSYIPSSKPSSDLSMLAFLLTDDQRCLDDREETALITDEETYTRYRILMGDFRQDYLGIAAQGLAACIQFFDSQKEDYGSPWSTNVDDVPHPKE